MAGIESILLRDCRLDKARPILAGVSGGPDSLCLLLLLHQTGWKVIAAHFNHMLRDQAEEEAEAVRAVSEQLALSFVGGKGDVRRHAAERRLSIEAAGRDLRYRFLFEQARRHDAQAVAVGHTADDQAETVLMHLIRGAGLTGLKGMPYRTVLPEYDAKIPLVRPLLDWWRAETVACCESHGLKVHYDISNESPEFLRNRIRHELIPALETYNPRIREALWRSSKTLGADHELLTAALQPAWEQVVQRQSEHYVSLDVAALGGQPAALQMHLLRRAVECLRPGCELDYGDLQRAAAFIAGTARDETELTGGLLLLREGGTLYVFSSAGDLPSDHWPQMPPGVDALSFSVPFRASLAGGWQFTAEPRDMRDLPGAQPWKEVKPFQALIDVDGLPPRIELRVRRDGDRFLPLGMRGHSQKLSDFFINAKLPARARHRWPLVCAGSRVLWVPGYRPAESCRVRPETQLAVLLAIQHLV